MGADAQERTFGAPTLRLQRADITTLHVDAIVNAANQSLAGGGGVDGALHRAGGPDIMRELRERYSGCPTGSAVISGGGRLPARHVIHAVGPRWRDGRHGEPELLRAAYDAAFALATQHRLQRVATASLSTGIYGFPVDLAAPIALDAARRALEDGATSLHEIVFALFSDDVLRVYAAALRNM